jgi:DNA polymerase elongation subunit (family B)
MVNKIKSFRLVDFHVKDCKTTTVTEEETEKKTPEKKPPDRFAIQVFGINEIGETASFLVNDFEPFFYIRVGPKWSQYDADNLLTDLRKRVRCGTSLLRAEITNKKKLFGFAAGGEDRFVCLYFANMAAFRQTSGLWYRYDQQGARKRVPLSFHGAPLELYESGLPPLLRYFHIHNISPSGWILAKISKMRAVPVTEQSTTCSYEYVTSQKWIAAQPNKETRVPYKICSFDIEASSSHGDFPVPVKTYKRLATQIVDAVIALHEDRSHVKARFVEWVLHAFSFQSGVKNHYIDSVFPKEPPSESELRAALAELLSENRGGDDRHKKKARLLTLDAHFSMATEKARFVSEDEDHESVDQELETENIIDYYDDDDDDANPDSKIHKGVPLVPLQLVQPTQKWMENDATREERIQSLNTLLTTYLPELEGDQTTFIGSTFLRYGETEPYLNHCLVVGSCDTVAGAVVESHATENELLIAWTALIQRENPDIIIGYNIFGFDYEFLFRRALENGCEEAFLQLSRNRGHVGAKIDKDTEEWCLENTRIRLASGEYDLHYPLMIGRLQIDLYAYFRKEFNLPSYKLDDVSGLYISDTIVGIDIDKGNGKTHLLRTKNVTGLNRGDYIHIEVSEFTSDTIENGRKYPVLDVIMCADSGINTIVIPVLENAATVAELGAASVDKSKTIRWCLAKDDVSPQDIFRLTRGDAADRARVAKYCIQDCNIVHHLMRKIDLLVGFIEMARICSVPMSFLVLRGQGIKLTSFVAKKCREKNTLMPDLEKCTDNDGYEGAIVLPPKCGMYIDNPVACLDYSSLYPSNMISQNLSHDSKVWVREYDMQGRLVNPVEETVSPYDNLPGMKYVDVEFDTFRYVKKNPAAKAQKVKCGRRLCRWAQTSPPGILPAILEELLRARKATKKQAEKETDEFMKNILDKRQLAYKVTANSLYGQCGSKTSTFYEKDIAASTTAIGRMMIMYAKRMIEEIYGDSLCKVSLPGAGGAAEEITVQTRAEYIYGDTDSVFFTFNLEEPDNQGNKIVGKRALEITIELAQEAARLCTQFLKAPMELSYEKTQMPFILLSKKRYVSILYETNPNKGKLKFMGLSLKRRDACDYLKDVYGGILTRLLKTKGTGGTGGTNDTENGSSVIESSIAFLDTCLLTLIEGRVPMDKLCLTKSLRSEYKRPETIGHKVLADRIGERDPGNKPKSGDRIQFAFVRNEKNPKALVGDRIETPEFIVSHSLSLDYTYYITNQLMKPLQQLFGLALEDIWASMNKRSAISQFRKDMAVLQRECGGDLERYMKEREKETSKRIKVLLFDKYLRKVQQRASGLRGIDAFFGNGNNK